MKLLSPFYLFALLSVLLLACEKPLDPLVRDNELDPKSVAFTPDKPTGYLSATGDAIELEIFIFPKDEYYTEIQVEKSLYDGIWSPLEEFSQDEDKVIDQSKRFTANTYYRFRVINVVKKDTAFSEWEVLRLDFSFFNRQATLGSGNTISWIRHHPLVTGYNVYYVSDSDPTNKKELTLIQSSETQQSHTFQNLRQDPASLNRIYIDGLVADGDNFDVVTQEILLLYN